MSQLGLMLTTRQVAKRLGIAAKTLSRYVIAGKVPTPRIIQFGKFRVHSWTEPEVEQLRELLPKIANGRKTRHQKQPVATKSKTNKTKPKK